MTPTATSVVTEIWRYPVKSMGGHRVASAAIGARGLHADRLWAVRDLELGATTTARRLPALMLCSARFAAEPPSSAGPGRPVEVVVTFPGGREVSSSDPAVHEHLTELVGRAVELRPLPALDDKAQYRAARVSRAELRADLRRQFGVADGEPFPDLSTLPIGKLAELTRYATPLGSFADAFPLHLLSTGSIAAMRALTPSADFDVRRFRPNVVVDGSDEFGWCGGVLVAGDLALDVVAPTVRCSIPVRPQPGLEAQPEVMRTIRDHSDRCLGVYAEVRAPGTLAEGDELRLEPGRRGSAGRLAGRLRRGVVRASTRAVLGGRGS
jgi:uncharacterized protein YcbX